MILWLSANNSKKTLHNSPVRVRYGVSFGSSKSGLHRALVIVKTYYVDHIITNIIMVRSHHICQDTSWCQILFGTKPQHFKQKTAHNLHRLTVGWISTVSTLQSIVRTVPLLKPPQIPHCYLGAVDHVKKSPPPLVTLQARSYRAHRSTQTLYRAHCMVHSDPIVLKPFDLTQVCHGNKICSKLALTLKLTLELSFPAHCISNWKLNGISRTNISKVVLNAANELPRLRRTPPTPIPSGPRGGGKMWSGGGA